MIQPKSNRQRTRDRFRRKVLDRIRTDGGITSLWLSSSAAAARAVRDLLREGKITMEREGFPNYRCTIVGEDVKQ